MPLYDNQTCPVCKNEFQEGDDVVFCPECGTPHHRECYNISGHCVNAGLHKTGFNYYEQKQKAAVDEAPVTPENIKAQAEAASSQAAPFVIPLSAYEKDSETIGNEKAIDVAAAIRTNIPRFMNIFKASETSKKKVGWNWSAFFFGEYYFFFRKMYKQAVALTGISLIINILQSFLFMKFAPKALEAMRNFAEAYALGNSAITEEKVNAIMSISDYGKLKIILLLVIAVSIIIRVIEAMFADCAYKGSVLALIRRVKKQLDDGNVFSQISLSPFEVNPNLSQEQMKWIYLSRRGGTSFFAPAFAALTVDLILRIISNL